MIKRVSFLILILSTLVAASAFNLAHAEDAPASQYNGANSPQSSLTPAAASVEEQLENTSDEKFEKIHSICKSTQITLNQIHVNDALARVNLGRRYEDVSSKLMSPLNSRAAANGQDSSSMVAITADYNDNLQRFRQSYQVYEEVMSSAINIDCLNHVKEFYAFVLHAKEYRHNVGKNVEKLNSNIKDYSDKFQEFRANIANHKRAK